MGSQGGESGNVSGIYYILIRCIAEFYLYIGFPYLPSNLKLYDIIRIPRIFRAYTCSKCTLEYV